MLTFLLWVLLLVFCWPLALLALVLYPIVWLLLLPFRLVVVIDHLLETPDLHEPVALTQQKVMYEFADPALEKRSAGQKLLLRSGPENERAIKSKLREIRAALTGQALPPA